MTENLREIVLDILLSVFRDGVYSNLAVHAALEKYQYFSKRERAFITKVSEGTVERQIEIDYIIDQFSTVPVEKMKPVIQNILRSAVYQIRYLGSVPDSAAVSEAVQLAQNRGFYNLKGFVNGVLRNIARNADNIRYPDPEEDLVRYLTITRSMPEWLTKRFVDEYGPFVTERMLDSFLEERPTTVRIKTERVTKNEILTSLRNQGVTVHHAPYLPYAYNLTGYNYLMALNAFKNGWIYPQDVSSMLVTEAADPKPGDNVIDLCAAPGGKSLHIADRMAGYGMVEARDVSIEKVALIEENVRRANLINVHPVVKDALVFDPDSEASADIVIADLPCSGLGVIGRKADIKYHVTPDKIDELVKLQRQILENGVRYVKPGGVFIFSTCTLTREENVENVAWIKEHTDLIPESLDPYIPAELKRITTSEGYLQLLPGIHESDGFFISRFRRKMS